MIDISVLSQNGYVANDPTLIVAFEPVPGVKFPGGVRAGNVATILTWFVRRWHHEVEALVPGWCWGYSVRPIRGGTELSNHASGTAVDLNAPKHPLGVRGTFSPNQRKAIKALLADADGVLRWGGDYTGRVDEMHVEVVGDAAAVAALATKLVPPIAAPPVAKPAPAPTPTKPPVVPADEDGAMNKLYKIICSGPKNPGAVYLGGVGYWRHLSPEEHKYTIPYDGILRGNDRNIDLYKAMFLGSEK